MMYRYGVRGREVRSQKEIAVVMGVSKSTVRTLIQGAWKHLMDEDDYLLSRFTPDSGKMIKMDAGIK